MRQDLLKELYMAETIGLDIGSHSIKLVGLKTTSKGPFLTRVGVKSISPGKDSEDVAHVIDALKDLLKEVGVKPGKVSLVVSGSRVHIRRIIVPSMPRAELKEAVRWTIKEQLPFPIESARIDSYLVDEFVEENVKKLDLIVVACPNQLIDRTLSIAARAGLEPSHLDVAPFALWNALLMENRIGKEEAIAVVDLGAAKTGIHLFNGGVLQFSREVTPAGADITRAIMEGVGNEGESHLLFERAERIKGEVGIPSETDPDEITDESIKRPKVTVLIRPVLERMAVEIGRSLDYYKSQFNVDRIDRLLLTGGGANLKNIGPYLAAELRLPVELFNPLKELLFDSKKIALQTLDETGCIFTVATGTALPGPKRIELLPARRPFVDKTRMVKWIPLFAPLITLLFFLGIVWNMDGQVAALQAERDSKMARVTAIETLRTKMTLLKEKEGKLKQELSLFPSLIAVGVPHPEVLREVSRMIPSNVTLTQLEVQAGAKPPKKQSQAPKPQAGEFEKGGERELFLNGIVFGSDLQCLTALAQIIERLEGSPLFKNARLVSAEEIKSYNQPGAKFEIISNIAFYNPPTPPFTKGGR